MTEGPGAGGAEDADRPGGSGSPRSAEPTPAAGRRRLRLTDPLVSRAAEDNPESWGDREPDPDPAARYARERPPHHGD